MFGVVPAVFGFGDISSRSARQAPLAHLCLVRSHVLPGAGLAGGGGGHGVSDAAALALGGRGGSPYGVGVKGGKGARRLESLDSRRKRWLTRGEAS